MVAEFEHLHLVGGGKPQATPASWICGGFKGSVHHDQMSLKRLQICVFG